MFRKRSLLTLVLVISTAVLAIALGILAIISEATAVDRNGETDSWIYVPIISKPDRTIYESVNLSGHSLFAECNPGNGTSCACSELDVDSVSFPYYGEVTSNSRQRNTYVNAIAYKKFTELFPTGEPLSLGTYRYRGEFSLPVLPKSDVRQAQNPQAIHMMIQFWDGRNELYQSDNHTLEAVIYWDLNPWTPDYGKIKVYKKPVTLTDTGIKLTPDTDWHSFELVADLQAQRYVRVTIDDITVDLSHLELAQVHQPTWGTDVSLSITTESMASWPKTYCDYIFWWTTRFRNVRFSFH